MRWDLNIEPKWHMCETQKQRSWKQRQMFLHMILFNIKMPCATTVIAKRMTKSRQKRISNKKKVRQWQTSESEQNDILFELDVWANVRAYSVHISVCVCRITANFYSYATLNSTAHKYSGFYEFTICMLWKFNNLVWFCSRLVECTTCQRYFEFCFCFSTD